jgi:hypothetical protein
MFRLLFLSANLFLLIFSVSLPVISIDSVLFNIAFIFTNIYLTIPLVKNIIPPKFSIEQKEIFKNHFKNYLKPIELEFLLSTYRRRIYRVTTNIVRKGNEFSSIFFIAKKGKNCKIEQKSRKRNFELQEYSWVGVHEYLSLISTKHSLFKSLKEFDTGNWTMNFKVSFRDSSLINDDSIQKNNNELQVNSNLSMEDSSRIDDDNFAVIYEFELRSINHVFTNLDHGSSIMRALHSIWLKYCSEIIKMVDKEKLAANNKNAMSISSLLTETQHSISIVNPKKQNNR